jgi:hypothetical protein
MTALLRRFKIFVSGSAVHRRVIADELDVAGFKRHVEMYRRVAGELVKEIERFLLFGRQLWYTL